MAHAALSEDSPYRKDMGGQLLERAANVAIIVTCVAILGALYLTVEFPRRRPVPVRRAAMFEPGRRVSVIPDAVYRATEVTVVVLLQSNCRLCTESMPFYRRLAGQRHAFGGSIALAVLTADSATTVAAYLWAQGLQVDHVIAVSPSHMAGYVVPTLLLLDRSGIVVKVWVGRLDSKREPEVFEALRAALAH